MEDKEDKEELMNKEELRTLLMPQGTSHCSCLEHCFLFIEMSVFCGIFFAVPHASCQKANLCETKKKTTGSVPLFSLGVGVQMVAQKARHTTKVTGAVESVSQETNSARARVRRPTERVEVVSRVCAVCVCIASRELRRALIHVV